MILTREIFNALAHLNSISKSTLRSTSPSNFTQRVTERASLAICTFSTSPLKTKSDKPEFSRREGNISPKVFIYFLLHINYNFSTSSTRASTSLSSATL